MATYGRNFDFRIPPEGSNRNGRWVLSETGLDAATILAGVPIGAPVVLDTSVAASTTYSNASNCKLATGAQAPAVGVSGILVYEYGPAAFAGDDPFLTTYSDKDKAPVDKLVQVVSDLDIKVVFKNTVSRKFLVSRTYTARTMVAGIGIATPTLIVGDYLTPGVGTDAAGYWAETSDVTKAWFVITNVDNARAEVEARMLF